MPEDMQRLAVSLNASSSASGNPEVWSIPQDVLVSKVIKDESPSGGRTTIELDTEDDFLLLRPEASPSRALEGRWAWRWNGSRCHSLHRRR